MSDDVLFADETYRIRGAIFEVSNVLGAGFLEGVYQECLAIEFVERGIPFVQAPTLRLTYKEHQLKQTYAPDFICFDTIILELKAARDIAPEHRAQVLNYLRSTGLRLGLLVNFGSARVQIERLAL